MTDIVERLRDPTYSGSMRHLQDWSEIDALMSEAAAEITRLRQELAEARESCTRANELINAAVTDYNEARAKAFKEVITVINQMPAGHRPGMKWARDAEIAAAIRSIAEKEPT